MRSSASLLRPHRELLGTGAGDEDVVDPRAAVHVARERRVREVEVAGEDARLAGNGKTVEEGPRPFELGQDDAGPAFDACTLAMTPTPST